MKLLYTTIILFIASIGLYGQNFTNDAGLRFNSGVTVSYRQFYKEDMAVEAYIGYRQKCLRIGGVREFFKPALTKYSENFLLYYGYGVHAGLNYTNSYKILNRKYKYDWKVSPVFGMNGVVGMEYHFIEVPILIALDLRPLFEFSLNRFFELNIIDVAFSLKYRF